MADVTYFSGATKAHETVSAHGVHSIEMGEPIYDSDHDLCTQLITINYANDSTIRITLFLDDAIVAQHRAAHAAING